MFRRLLAPALILALSSLAAAQPITNAFTFQGQLQNGGSPVSGTYDIQFRLFDAATAGGQFGPTLCSNNIAITNGQVTTQLRLRLPVHRPAALPRDLHPPRHRPGLLQHHRFHHPLPAPAADRHPKLPLLPPRLQRLNRHHCHDRDDRHHREQRHAVQRPAPILLYQCRKPDRRSPQRRPHRQLRLGPQPLQLQQHVQRSLHWQWRRPHQRPLVQHRFPSQLRPALAVFGQHLLSVRQRSCAWIRRV